MTPLDVMKQALEALESCIHDPRMQHTASVHYEVGDAGRMLSKAITELESAEPVAWITGGDCYENGYMDCRAWKDGEFTTPLYLHPAQSRNDNEPTYGQLKIRLEKAQQTIEMQRCALLHLRDTNRTSRDSIIEECAAVCEEVHSRYSTDIFPEGRSVTAQSAKMARITSNNCALEMRALKGK